MNISHLFGSSQVCPILKFDWIGTKLFATKWWNLCACPANNCSMGQAAKLPKWILHMFPDPHKSVPSSPFTIFDAMVQVQLFVKLSWSFHWAIPGSSNPEMDCFNELHFVACCPQMTDTPEILTWHFWTCFPGLSELLVNTTDLSFCNLFGCEDISVLCGSPFSQWELMEFKQFNALDQTGMSCLVSSVIQTKWMSSENAQWTMCPVHHTQSNSATVTALLNPVKIEFHMFNLSVNESQLDRNLCLPLNVSRQTHWMFRKMGIWPDGGRLASKRDWGDAKKQRTQVCEFEISEEHWQLVRRFSSCQGCLSTPIPNAILVFSQMTNDRDNDLFIRSCREVSLFAWW